MLSPFLKWAGGKRWLTASDQLLVPADFRRYIEPFLGGGAMFFHLRPAAALLSDLNAELIELYQVVRDAPDALLEKMAYHQAKHDKGYYYSIRCVVPDDLIERAARTLYLNRTCWNGLYRVNRKGEFNVPIGTKTSVVLENESFLNISEALRNAELRCADFEETIELSGDGDFVFVDPPYTARHNMNGFLKYNEQIFSWDDQVRLRDAIGRAIYRGSAVVVTNADHESVRELYGGLCDYRQLHRASVLSSISSRRGPTTEAMFSANLRLDNRE